MSKLVGMVFDIGDFDHQGNVSVVEVARRLKNALDIERVTKKFFKDFESQHVRFLGLIEGIDNEADRRWYASVLLNRLMFIYFLQKKGFLYVGRKSNPTLDGDYLGAKLAESQKAGKDRYYSEFLKKLFFIGFARPDDDPEKQKIAPIIGDIPYLNGGLFLPHPIEDRYPGIAIPDQAFESLLELFGSYSWSLDDTPGGKADEINPDVLGYIFEKYINQKAFGAYYTRPEITRYLCECAVHNLILEKVNALAPPPSDTPEPGRLFAENRKTFFNDRRYDSVADLLLNLDDFLCAKLFDEWLPDLKLLDPACGSGAFLVAAMKTLVSIYSAVIGRIEFVGSDTLKKKLKKLRDEHHGSLDYVIKKRIITDNLFGVDVMEEATEIAKLRLFLTLVASAKSRAGLEPLPNIDFNILAGNSLIGLLNIDLAEIGKKHPLFAGAYRGQVQSLLAQIRAYRHATTYTDDLRTQRDAIATKKVEINAVLNDVLHDRFSADLKIKFEQATWDDKTGTEGKPVKRSLTIRDITALRPFHWGFEFDDVFQRGGFDAIITNPPWEIFKPQAKEFFAERSALVTKNKMTVKEFEKEQAKLLKDPEIREAWLEYQSRFPYVSLYYRAAPQFENQIAVVNGKKAGTDINLYKLFLEQCFRLLRLGGECGIVIPSGIYTDLGTKQLRKMLFERTKIAGLFCFENRKEIFEGVHRSFKFVVLTFEKGKTTREFPSAFMRHDVEELERFPKEGAMPISVQLIEKLSPDSLSIMEFNNEADVRIAEKMLRFPLLGEKIEGAWNLKLSNEFHMTNDSHLFKTEPGEGRLPLYEGKMIHQFTHQWGKPKYWIDESEARSSLIGKKNKDVRQKLNYQNHRLAYREIAANTNERGLICTLLPKNVFANHKLQLSSLESELSKRELFFCCAIFNSFVFDFMVRQRVTTSISMFVMYQLPVPRSGNERVTQNAIVERASRLICTTPEFDELAREVGLRDHRDGVTDEVERARLRAELDGLVAHLYGLTEKEFAYILTTFPLVPEPVKVAAQNAYRDVERGLVK
jgi:Alw26I/Eco31I/Esp3I family type II restriction m6 adenine DNA methyltransferase